MASVPAVLLRLAVAVVGLVTASSWAAAPPEFPFPDGLAQATLAARPATALHLGDYAVQFEQTALLDVVHTLGSGKINHQGDAGGSLSWICYDIPGKRLTQRLWITAGELQNGKVADGVIAREAVLPRTPDCPVLPAKYRPAQIDHALWLGSSRAAADHALGPASSERGGWLEYEYQGKYRVAAPQSGGDANLIDYDEVDGLLLRLLDGRVVELFANKATTN